MTQRIAAVLPAGIVLLATLLAALPWGVPAPMRFGLMLMPVVVIIHFTLFRPSLIPSPIAFAAGLMLDVVTYGPLGYWSALNVGAQLLAAALSRGAPGGIAARAALVAVLVGAVSMAGWAIAVVGFADVIGWRPVAIGAAVAVAGYPLFAVVAAPFERVLTQRGDLQLERGG